MAAKKKTEITTGVVDAASLPMFLDFLGDDAKALLDSGAKLAVIGAAEGSKAVGAACGYADEDGCFNILGIYVAPKYRKKGIGTELLNAVAETAKGVKKGIPVRLAFCEGDAEAESLLAFMKALGYKETDRGERLYRFTVGDLKNKAYFPAKYKNPHLKSFAEMRSEEIKKIAVRTAQRHRDMPEDGFTSARVKKDCSFAYFRNGIVKGYLVCDDTSGGELTVSALFVRDKFAMAGLLRAFASAIKAKHKAATLVCMPVPTDRYDDLFEKLFPGVKNLEHNFEI